MDWKVAGGSGAAALVIAALAVSTGASADAMGYRDGVRTPLPVADGPPPPPTATPTPTDVGKKPLLPNMRSKKATGVHIAKSHGVRRILFSSTLVNVGKGPLEVRPRPAKRCPAGQRDVEQAVYQDKNKDRHWQRATERKRVFRQSGCMEFHPSHNHWHVDASARYWLTEPGVTKAIVKHAKVSFCLRDSVRLPDRKRHAFYGHCTRDARQGITPGWGDLYQWFLPGQSLRLPPHFPRGLYCLHQRADPRNVFTESNETDNDSVRAIRIKRTQLTYVTTKRCN